MCILTGKLQFVGRMLMISVRGVAGKVAEGAVCFCVELESFPQTTEMNNTDATLQRGE
jgi:hypothetical protein